MRLILALLLFVSGPAWAGPFDSVAPAPTGTAARQAANVAPGYYTPDDFGAVGDAVQFGAPFVIESGATRLGLGAVYYLNGICTSNTGTPNQTVCTFPSNAMPVNLAYTGGSVMWDLRCIGCGSSGATVVKQNVTVSVAGNVVTITGGAGYVVTNVTNGNIVLNPDMMGPSRGSSYVAYYAAAGITTAAATMDMTSGIPQAVLSGALANSTLAKGVLTVSKITLADASITSGSVNAATSGQENGRAIQIGGAGAGGSVYNGTIVQETTDGQSLYVWPPVSTALSSTPGYVIYGPYLFQPCDAGCGAAGAKYVEVPFVGTTPSSAWVGQLPLIATVASYIDPLNITIGTASGATVPASSSTPIPGGRIKIGHNDLAPVIQAFQMASENGKPGSKFVSVPRAYFLPTLTQNPSIDLATLNRAIPVGDGQLIYPTQIGGNSFAHGVAPLAAIRAPAAPEVAEFDAASTIRLCNDVPGACIVDIMGNSQFTPFTNGPSQIDNWAIKFCDKIQRQMAPKTIVCQQLAIGGSTWLQADPNGNTAGVPASASGYQWYNSAGLTTKWLDILKNGIAAGTIGQTIVACPHVIIAEFTNVDGLAYSEGAMEDTIAYTQTTGAGSWNAACGYNPGWLLALDGNQPIGDPAMNSYWQQSGDYVKGLIRGAARGCMIPMAEEKCLGIASDLNRLQHVLVDGFDPVSQPLYIADYLPNVNATSNAFPLTWPGLVSDWAWNLQIKFSPGGACTLVSATSFANNLANSTCIWGLVNNELDWQIGYPNGSQTGNNPAWPTQWLQEYAHNQVRLLYNASANQYGTGSAAGMMDYEVDVYNETAPAVASGTSGTSTVSCTSTCANWKFLNAVVTDTTGGKIPANTCLQTMDTNGQTLTLKVCGTASTPATLTGTMSAGSVLNFKKMQIPPTSTGQYGFICNGQTNTGSNFALLFPAIEVRGNQVTANLCSGLGGAVNLFQTNVARFGGYFSPVVSTPAGSPATVKVNWNSYGTYSSAMSRESRPWQPIYQPTYTILDLYGWAPPDNIANSVVFTPDCDGQVGNHRGGCGSKIEDIALAAVRFNSGAIPVQQRAVGVFQASTTAIPLLTVPANACLTTIKIQNTTTNAVTGGINIGTTVGGADVASAFAVGASANTQITGASLLKQCLGAANTPLYISAVTSWNSASLNVQAVYSP